MNPRRYEITQIPDGKRPSMKYIGDFDNVVFEAIMTEFEKFCRGELGWTKTSCKNRPEGSCLPKDIRPKVRRIYRWWILGRKMEYDKVENLWKSIEKRFPRGKWNKVKGKWSTETLMEPLHRKYVRQTAQMENKLYEKDTAMMIELLKIRHYLWT